MSRYFFTPQGVINLKKSINQTLCIIDNLFWLDSFATLKVMSMSNREKTISEGVVNSFFDNGYFKFKPKRSLILDEIARVFGYKGFQELLSVSKSQEPSQSLIIGESEYLEALSSIFEWHFMSFSNDLKDTLNKSHASNFIKIASYLSVSAWELNSHLKENLTIDVNLVSSSKDSFIKNSKMIVGNSGVTLNSPVLGEYLKLDNERISGSLLPLIGKFDIEDIRSAIPSDNSVLIFQASLDELLKSEEKFILSQPHFEAESLISSKDSMIEMSKIPSAYFDKHSSLLLALLTALQPFHRSRAEKVNWFLKPHSVDDWKRIFTESPVDYLFENSLGQLVFKPL